MSVSASRKGRAHHPGAADRRPDETVALVQLECRIVRLDAEADRSEALPARMLEQRREQVVPVPVPPPARHDGDRQLRRPFLDEAEPWFVAGEQPVPASANRLKPLDRDERESPAPHLPRIGPAAGRITGSVQRQ
jgi:hypothetical protein